MNYGKYKQNDETIVSTCEYIFVLLLSISAKAFRVETTTKSIVPAQTSRKGGRFVRTHVKTLHRAYFYTENVND